MRGSIIIKNNLVKGSAQRKQYVSDPAKIPVSAKTDHGNKLLPWKFLGNCEFRALNNKGTGETGTFRRSSKIRLKTFTVLV